MPRLSLPIAAVLAACAPSPRKVAMPSPSAVPGPILQGLSEAGEGGGGLATPLVAAPHRGAGHRARAAQGPSPEPVSAAESPAPAAPRDDLAEAVGRRTLSTAFVRVGPDGHLTVELRDGRVLVLRDVAMGPKKYCGVQDHGNAARARYCGTYAEVVAARPGGGASLRPGGSVGR